MDEILALVTAGHEVTVAMVKDTWIVLADKDGNTSCGVGPTFEDAWDMLKAHL